MAEASHHHGSPSIVGLHQLNDRRRCVSARSRSGPDRAVGGIKKGADEGGPNPSELGSGPDRARHLERMVEMSDDDLAGLATAPAGAP